jgi:hypothetical protein
VQDSEFPLVEDNAFPGTLRKAFMNEVKALESLGFPQVDFLLQHEYTQSGAVKEVFYREEHKYLFVLPSLMCGQVSKEQVSGPGFWKVRSCVWIDRDGQQGGFEMSTERCTAASISFESPVPVFGRGVSAPPRANRATALRRSFLRGIILPKPKFRHILYDLVCYCKKSWIRGVQSHEKALQAVEFRTLSLHFQCLQGRDQMPCNKYACASFSERFRRNTLHIPVLRLGMEGRKVATDYCTEVIPLLSSA